MQIRKAERKKARIKMALQGPSGSGKTYSSILLAKGLAGDLSKVCIIDTENNSADLYAHMGDFNVLNLKPPYTPERYIQAIETAEKAEMDVIITDSLSHAWENLLEYHSSLSGNSFANWRKVTPRQRSLITKILSADAHVIATMRVKQDYVLTENDKGKLEPQKVGLKAIQRDGVDYEFTLVFDLDIAHHVQVSKDRTGLFTDTPEFKITEETGQKIMEWCNEGVSAEHVRRLILKAKSIQELTDIYNEYQAYLPVLKSTFTARKEAIANNSIKPLKPQQNGSPNQH